MVYGFDYSDCLTPCLTTKVCMNDSFECFIVFQAHSSLLGEETNSKYSVIEIAVDQRVATTEYYFPQFNLVDFFASLGGSLGLWLGVGIMQIGVYGTEFIDKLKANCKKA